jgi:hypothetical protein
MIRHRPITISTDFRDGNRRSIIVSPCLHPWASEPPGIGASARRTVNFEFKRGATIRVATGWS